MVYIYQTTSVFSSSRIRLLQKKLLRFNDPRVVGIKDILHFLFASSLTEGTIRLEIISGNRVRKYHLEIKTNIEAHDK